MKGDAGVTPQPEIKASQSKWKVVMEECDIRSWPTRAIVIVVVVGVGKRN